MSVYTVISTNYPEELEVDKHFPKCVCGGEFRVYDNYNKRKEFFGTTADCKECGEHFCMDNYMDLKKRIPKAQKFRAESKK